MRLTALCEVTVLRPNLGRVNYSLFRRLLREHRKLPIDMRSLGDDYIKSGDCIRQTTIGTIFLNFMRSL